MQIQITQILKQFFPSSLGASSNVSDRMIVREKSSPSLYTRAENFLISLVRPKLGVPSKVFPLDESGVRKIDLRAMDVGPMTIMVSTIPYTRGGSSEVYCAQSSNGILAVKKFIPSTRNESPDFSVLAQRAEYELYSLQELNKRGVRGVPLAYGLSIDGKTGQPSLVMQMVEGCTFQDIIRRKVNKTYTTRDLLLLAKQAVAIVENLYMCGCMHGDLKPSNFRVTPKGEVFLVDFGSTIWMNDPSKGSEIRTIATEGYGFISGPEIMDHEGLEKQNLLNLGEFLYAFLGNGETVSPVDGLTTVSIDPPLNSKREGLPDDVVNKIHQMLNLTESPVSLSEMRKALERSSKVNLVQRIFASAA